MLVRVPQCTLCRSGDRPAIDDALLHGATDAAIVARFPPLSKSAVNRHRNHLPIIEHDQGESLLRDVLAFQAEMLDQYRSLKASGRTGLALQAAREVIRLFDLRVRMQPTTVLPAEVEQAAATIATALGQDPLLAVQRFREAALRNGYRLPDNG